VLRGKVLLLFLRSCSLLLPAAELYRDMNEQLHKLADRQQQQGTDSCQKPSVDPEARSKCSRCLPFLLQHPLPCLFTNSPVISIHSSQTEQQQRQRHTQRSVLHTQRPLPSAAAGPCMQQQQTCCQLKKPPRNAC
jgi:hypothetical protein